MDTISELIDVLTPKQQEGFVSYLKARNKRHDARNIALFKSHLKGHNPRKKLTGADHALNMRLKDRLLDFLANTSFEHDAGQQVAIIKLILVGRKLMQHGKYKMGFKILQKADAMATELTHYSLRGEILHTLIQFSYREEVEDQQELLEEFEKNQNAQLAEERLNMAYAVIRRQFHENQSEGEALASLVTEVYEQYQIPDEIGYSFKSLYQIAQIADLAGALSSNYHSIDLFFVDKVDALANGPLDNKGFLSYHIDVLFLIANIYFRQLKFEASIRFLERMHQQMKRYDAFLFEQKRIQHDTLLALNLNYMGKPEEAMEMLNALLDLNEEVGLLNCRLARIMIFFQQGDLKSAKTGYADFQRTDNWYLNRIGADWVMKKNLMEILLYIELGDVDYADSRMRSFLRKYKEMLGYLKETQAMTFVYLVQQYYRFPDRVQSQEFKEKVAHEIAWKPRAETDIFIMSFLAWLKSKMMGESLYDATLKYVGTIERD